MKCPVCNKECATLDDILVCVSAHKKDKENQQKQLVKAEQDKRLKEVDDAYAVAGKAYEDANKIAQAYLKDYPNSHFTKHIEIPFGRLTYSDFLSVEDLINDITSALGYTKAEY
jgi:phage tail tube protein FII